MKIGIVILARMGSTRLPGKVMKLLAGKSVLAHVLERLSRVNVSPLIVATADTPDNQPLELFCEERGVTVFRGSEDNVLERCIQAADTHGLDAIFRLGADNPLVDPDLLNRMLEKYERLASDGTPPDYLSNSMERTFPLGLDAEIITVAALKRVRSMIADMDAEERAVHESNVIPLVHQHPELFRTVSFSQEADYSHLRWTLDTPEDYDLIQRIFSALYFAIPEFSMHDVLRLLEQHPDWSSINADVQPLTGFWTDHEQEKLEQRGDKKS